MKHYIASLLAAGALLVGATSCHESWTPPMGSEGSVNLKSFVVDVPDFEATVVASSTSRATYDMSDYLITVTDLRNGSATRSWRYAETPEVMTLPAGDYRLDVVSHQVAKAEWERPLFAGSKEFSVSSGKITDIGIVTASFASLKVTVEFTDELRAMLGDDVVVTIIANDEGELQFTPEETRAGYFEVLPGSNTMVAHFEGTVNGTHTTYDTPFIDIAAGQHRILTYKTKTSPSIPEQTGTIDASSGIAVDASVTTEEIGADAVVEEDVIEPGVRPGTEEGSEPVNPPVDPEDPGKDEAATFAPKNSPNLSLTAVNQASDSFGNAVVNIQCPAGMKHLIVTITSDNASFNSIVGDLFGDASFDLAYPANDTVAENLANLSLPYGDAVIGKTDVDFDITSFVSMLLMYPSTNYEFKLAVTDNNDKCSTTSLRFKS